MKGLKDYNKKQLDFKFFGIAGPRMISVGIKNIFDYKQLNLIGFLEPLFKYFIFSKNIDDIVEFIMKLKPQLIITIDSKLFSLNLAKRLRNRFLKEKIDIPLVHIVLPTIWAYRPKRAIQWKGVYNRLYSILPNEKKYFKKFNIHTDYIGNPVFENFLLKKDKFKKIKNGNICLLLPGSRKKEIRYNLKVMFQSVKLINKMFQNITWVLPTLDVFKEDILKDLKRNKLERQIKLINFNENFELVLSSKVAIACSGTVTMQLALAGIPTIGIYKTDFLTGLIGKYLVNMSNVILPNFINSEQTIPFLFQEKCNAKNILIKFEDFYKNNKKYSKIFNKFSIKLLRNMKYNPKESKSKFQKNISQDILNLLEN